MDQTTPSLQEIQNKIRAAATSAGIDPDIALSIANAESVFSNAVKNTRSSARGLFQIVDDTWDRFGGDSKLRNDIDENIRVGDQAVSAFHDVHPASTYDENVCTVVHGTALPNRATQSTRKKCTLQPTSFSLTQATKQWVMTGTPE